MRAWSSLVRVAVVDVRVVRMLVHQRGVFVRMGVRLAQWVGGSMGMLVMLVVCVPMRVRQGLVRVLVQVALAQMKPEPKCHEAPRPEEHGGHALAEDRQPDHRADEGCHGEVRTGPGGPKRPHGQDVKHQTYTIAQQSNRQHGGQP
jgi:hypothetical protein